MEVAAVWRRASLAVVLALSLSCSSSVRVPVATVVPITPSAPAVATPVPTDGPSATVSASATDGPSPTASPTATATAAATATPRPTSSPTPASDGRLRLMAVGDVMLAQSIGRRIARRGPLAPWAEVIPLFERADLVVANLECTISERGTPWNKTFTFRAPLEAAESLALAGVDVVSLANNHAMDYGVPAFLDTLALLEQHGIQYAGGGSDRSAAHAPLVVERDGLRLAFLGYVLPFAGRPAFNTRQWAAGADTPGLAIGTPDVVAREVAQVREEVDVVVVMVHGGVEYTRAPSKTMRDFARAASNAGAQLVLGHHPHVLHGYQWDGTNMIAYSLGNFVFDYFTGRPNDTAILDLTISATGVESVDWIPVVIDDGFPRLASGDDARRILAQLPRYP